VYTDANPAMHTLVAGSTAPLGVEVRQTTWATDSPDFQGDVVYHQFEVYYEEGPDITDFHIGMFFDFDLGQAWDDKYGCDTLSDLIFAYNADNDETNYPGVPPAIGVKLVNGPVVATPGDSARFGFHLLPGYRNIGMTSFSRYVNGTDPVTPDETYNYLRGLERDGSVLANGTRYSFPGDPVARTGDLDPFGGNKHCVMGFGPLTLTAPDSQCVLIKIACGRGTDHLNSITVVKSTLNQPDQIPTSSPGPEEPTLPSDYALQQNYPNPFNPETVIAYELPRASKVELSIFNVLGQQVVTLVDSERPAGAHQVVWDGRDAAGRRVASGLYLYRLVTDSFAETRKMLLVR
jgi:hypothetical protein